jgi:hypothetical protein
LDLFILPYELQLQPFSLWLVQYERVLQLQLSVLPLLLLLMISVLQSKSEDK